MVSTQARMFQEESASERVADGAEWPGVPEHNPMVGVYPETRVFVAVDRLGQVERRVPERHPVEAGAGSGGAACNERQVGIPYARNHDRARGGALKAESESRVAGELSSALRRVGGHEPVATHPFKPGISGDQPLNDIRIPSVPSL
jgi:hypothetical protein